MTDDGLMHGPLGENCLHVCVDMQRLFGPDYPWAMAWLERVAGPIEALCRHQPTRTVFTRFIPMQHPGQGQGTWARYYQRWSEVTLDHLDPDAIRLLPALEEMVPPATVVDKHVYSPWTEGAMDRLLAGSGIDTLIISGGETDICVLATVLGAIDRGYRVVLVRDALCSASDETHDALMTLYLSRFSQQVEAASLDEILTRWL